MKTISFYDTKPFDRDSFARATDGTNVILCHNEFRLTAETARSAQGTKAVCVFVNDRLTKLADLGIKRVALLSVGFTNMRFTIYQAFPAHEVLSEIARVTLDSVVRFGRGPSPVTDRVLA